MKAQLRRLHSPDVMDLASFAPENPQSFSVFIQAMIGPETGNGEEAFGFIVCSPSWLGTELGASSRTHRKWGRGLLLMTSFELQDIVAAVTELCDDAQGDTWDELAESLAKNTFWEFDDYRP